MENRFGFKDFVFTCLGIAIIICIFLAMKQYDRQSVTISEINDNLKQETQQIAELARTLRQGVSFTNNGNSTTQESGPDPFVYAKQAEAQPNFARGDWLVDNFPVKVARLTPFGSSSDLYCDIIKMRVVEQLSYRDPNTLEYVPLLARSWQVSPDGMTIHIQLRRGLVFSDGQPLTADDVVFSFDWLMNKAVDAPRERAYYEKVQSVKKLSDEEVVVQFKEPYYDSLGLAVSLQILPKHFYSRYTVQQFNTTPGLLMGSGPYKLKDPATWTPGTPLELVRNENYWGERPTFDRLVWKEIEKDAVEMTAFKNGEIDIFRPYPEQYKLLLKDPQTIKANNHFEIDSPLSGYSFVGWNQKRNGKPAIFADKRVRQAMTLMTDRQAICDQIFLGYATIPNGPFWSKSKQNDPSIKPWPYDPGRAKQELVNLGFKYSDQGTALDPSGAPFSFKLTYGVGSQTIERMVLLLKDMYAKEGVQLIPDPVDWPILIKRLDNRDFDAVTLGWSASVESDLYQSFHSSQIADTGDDFITYANPKLDDLIVQARSTVDESRRMPLWHQCLQIIHEDQPYTFLLSPLALSFYDKRIQNVKTTRLGLNFIRDDDPPMPWYVPLNQQKWK